MAFLTAAEYPSIRAALDVSLDADALPDDIIELPIYAGSAELEVYRRDPDLYSRTGVHKRRCVNAMIFLTAAYLAPAMPQITSETLGDVTYGFETINWMKLAGELRERADSEIAAVISTVNANSAPSMFGLATGGRGA
jgi:hypothetical protein